MDKRNYNLYTTAQLNEFKKSINRMGEPIANGTAILDMGQGFGRGNDTSLEAILKVPANDKKTWRSYSRIFYSDSLYRRMLKYLATMFYNHYMITPMVNTEKKPNHKKLLNDYNAVLRTLDEDLSVEKITSKILLDLLIEGESFYFLQEFKKGASVYFKPIKLPTDYCKIIGTAGTPAVNIFAVDLSFIDKVKGELMAQKILTEDEILKQYPSELRTAYKNYKDKNKRGSQWYIVPVTNSMAFTTEDGRPPFAYLIKTLARINKFEELRDDYIATNLTKLLVQLIDIDKEGNPEIDLELAAEFHKNLREIASKKNNVDALTTLAKEVNVLSLGETGDATRNYDFLKTFYDQYYSDAGLSEEAFNSSTAGTMEYSEIKDEAFMSDLRDQIENWFNFFLNVVCNKKITKTTKFVFSFLETSYKNREKMIDSYLKGAQYGFSKLAPQIAMGVKQRYIESLVYFENDVLDLDAKLVPLQSSHTLSNKDSRTTQGISPTNKDSDVDTNQNGRPTVAQDEKKDSTITKDASK